MTDQDKADSVKRDLLGLRVCAHCGKEKPREEVVTKSRGLPQPCDLCVLHKPVTNDRCMEPDWNPK